MKTIFRKNVALIIGALVGLVSVGHAGESRSGPNMKGKSIPVQLERGVSLEQLNSAVQTCLVTGDQKRNIQSFVSRLHELIFNQQVRYSNTVSEIDNQRKSSYVLEGGNFEYILQEKRAPVETSMVALTYEEQMMKGKVAYSWTKENAILSVTQRKGYAPKSSHSNEEHPALLLNVDKQNKNFWLVTEDNFPLIKFENVVGEPWFDELGNIEADRTLVKGIKISVRNNFGKGGEILNFYNRGGYGFSGSDKPTPLKIDVTAYVQCLQSEIQYQAERTEKN